MANENGFITIDRKICSWEWYTDVNTFKLWIHCLLKANWKDGKFQGMDVPRGSFITSVRNLSKETGLTHQNVRTSLKNLENSQNLTHKSTNKYTQIFVINYDKFQSLVVDANTQPNNRLTHSQHTGNTQPNNNRTNKQVNQETKKTNKKESKKESSQSFDEILSSIQNVDLRNAYLEFIKMRKLVNKPLTSHALQLIMQKVNAMAIDDYTKIQILNQSIENSWQGVFPLKPVNSSSKATANDRKKNVLPF